MTVRYSASKEKIKTKLLKLILLFSFCCDLDKISKVVTKLCKLQSCLAPSGFIFKKTDSGVSDRHS